MQLMLWNGTNDVRLDS